MSLPFRDDKKRKRPYAGAVSDDIEQKKRADSLESEQKSRAGANLQAPPPPPPIAMEQEIKRPAPKAAAKETRDTLSTQYSSDLSPLPECRVLTVDSKEYLLTIYDVSQGVGHARRTDILEDCGFKDRGHYALSHPCACVSKDGDQVAIATVLHCQIRPIKGGQFAKTAEFVELFEKKTLDPFNQPRLTHLNLLDSGSHLVGVFHPDTVNRELPSRIFIVDLKNKKYQFIATPDVPLSVCPVTKNGKTILLIGLKQEGFVTLSLDKKGEPEIKALDKPCAGQHCAISPDRTYLFTYSVVAGERTAVLAAYDIDAGAEIVLRKMRETPAALYSQDQTRFMGNSIVFIDPKHKPAVMDIAPGREDQIQPLSFAYKSLNFCCLDNGNLLNISYDGQYTLTPASIFDRTLDRIINLLSHRALHAGIKSFSEDVVSIVNVYASFHSNTRTPPDERVILQNEIENLLRYVTNPKNVEGLSRILELLKNPENTMHSCVVEAAKTQSMSPACRNFLRNLTSFLQPTLAIESRPR